MSFSVTRLLKYKVGPNLQWEIYRGSRVEGMQGKEGDAYCIWSMPYGYLPILSNILTLLRMATVKQMKNK